MASFDSGDISQLAFIAEAGAGTTVTIYTVPANTKTLILEIRSFNSSTTHEIRVTNGTSSLELASGTAILSFQGKIVLDAADEVLIIKATNNTLRTVVSGIEVAA